MNMPEGTDIAIVLGGRAGQGIQTIEAILTRVLKRSGFFVFATKEYMSRIRGGSNSTLIRVADHRSPANVDRIDVLVALDPGTLKHLDSRLSDRTLVLGEKSRFSTRCRCVDVPFSRMAEDIGGAIYVNTLAIAVLCGLLDADLPVLEDHLKGHFAAKGDQVVERNLAAASAGFSLGADLRNDSDGRFHLPRLPRRDDIRGELLLSGSQAVALGAVSGGVNFVAAYPMSPGTSVLTYLAGADREFGIAVEQAEDEIAAVNMAIGAWYAGGRGMVTTSGGGFALMEEGVSLAGMTETPLVVHLGQRPGPATGMATRTEQADLELALHSGHGEFPRIIFAPGSVEEAFALAHRAFVMADRYQVPVFILTDQYLLDSFYSVPELVPGGNEPDTVVRSTPGYRRYSMDNGPVSPRAVPGRGDGLVCVDSHEHTEDGHVTEDIGLRNAMMEKRMGKLDMIRGDSVTPVLSGPESYRTLVVGWGSTRHLLAEAVAVLRRDDVAALHFPQVFPLPPETAGYLERARKVVVVENNYTGQFQRLLRAELLIDADHSIRQYDGRPFCSELLARRILKIAGRRRKK